MSSSDAMFEALSVYFNYVNEGAAYVKIDRVSRWCGLSKSLISLVDGWFLTIGVLLMKIKKLWEYKDVFLVFL